MSADPGAGRRAVPYLVMLVPAVLLGLLVTAQWRTQSARVPIASRYQLTLVEAAGSLQQEQSQLRERVAELRRRLDDIQRSAAGMSGEAAALQRQVDELRLAAGIGPLSGPGVVITLDDARLPATTPPKQIALGIIHSADITDVWNFAWRAGARGIAVNGERIVGTSACTGATIQINGTLMSPPFVIEVIGPPDALLQAFSDPGQLGDLRRRSVAFGLGFQIARSPELRLPAYGGPLVVRFAQPL